MKRTKRLTKADFEQQVISNYQKDVDNRENHPVHKKDLRHIMRVVFNTLSNDMINGYTVPVTGFAICGVTKHKSRDVRDPHGKMRHSRAHRYPHIRPCKKLKDEVKNA